MKNMSETLTTRISEAEAEIIDLEARLAAITDEKTAALGAAIVDGKTLARLEIEAQKIPLAIESQCQRIALLEAQREMALTEEASIRLRGLEAEYESIRGRLQAQHQAWLDGLAQLATLLVQNQQDRQQAQLLQDEGTFLHERFGTAWASLPPVPRPSRNDLNTTLEDIFRKGGWSLHTTNSWQEKTTAIRAEKNLTAQREADEARRTARSNSMVRMGTPPFTAGPQR